MVAHRRRPGHRGGPSVVLELLVAGGLLFAATLKPAACGCVLLLLGFTLAIWLRVVAGPGPGVRLFRGGR